jgi:hypothetical protein
MIVDLAKANRGKPHTRSSEAQDNSKWATVHSVNTRLCSY